ncbi:hypothetical protein [Thermoflavimicrobium daqui]|jgi:hypothetical protein|uniref:Uncharacterized protein n=1 Tax=Thermoflavimicrobium daqui TaxID=2137476 RepID=A0A364K7K9_9BACL|nr:hypothetical protein [Thermoflavimicrobium daqui]RAL26283.1 hypothetical protein DL897_04625 [Thermoflavimicrobium daqui]
MYYEEVTDPILNKHRESLIDLLLTSFKDDISEKDTAIIHIEVGKMLTFHTAVCQQPYQQPYLNKPIYYNIESHFATQPSIQVTSPIQRLSIDIAGTQLDRWISNVYTPYETKREIIQSIGKWLSKLYKKELPHISQMICTSNWWMLDYMNLKTGNLNTVRLLKTKIKEIVLKNFEEQRESVVESVKEALVDAKDKKIDYLLVGYNFHTEGSQWDCGFMYDVFACDQRNWEEPPSLCCGSVAFYNHWHEKVIECLDAHEQIEDIAWNLYKPWLTKVVQSIPEVKAFSLPVKVGRSPYY